ncbi:MAG: MoaD/ThiS family protein, partial [Synechococcus sp.]
MAIQVLIPTPLQKFTSDEASVSVEAASVDELLQALEGRFPGILARLCDENGKLRRFLNVYVNSE